MNILLLGPQGSGKGTQAKLIADAYGLAHVGTGDMLREAIANGTELGQRVQPLVESGQLVPDELMVELIRDRLARPDAADGFVLDGFPRTMAQAEALDAMLREIGRELDVVFELQISEAAAVERLLKRAEEEGRTDDTPEAIRTRLALYRQNTEPLGEHYRARGILVGVDAELPIPAVFEEIQRVLEQTGALA